MSLRFLLDTNVVIDVLRGAGPGIERELRRHAAACAVSTVTVSELSSGTERSADPDANRRATSDFLSFLDILDFDTSAAEHSGAIRAALAREGTPIGGYDVLLAGHARSRGLTMVTNNRREFDRVEGLHVIDWSG